MPTTTGVLDSYLSPTTINCYWDTSSTSATSATNWKEWTRVYRDEMMSKTNVVWKMWVDGTTTYCERRFQFDDYYLAQQPNIAYIEQWTQDRIDVDRQRIQQQQFVPQQDRRFSTGSEIEVMQQMADRQALEFERRIHLEHLQPFDLCESEDYKKIQENKKKAEEKAKKLLGSLIGDSELAVYDETKRLFVRGTKYDYIVPADGFIKAIGKDKVIDLCVHLKDKDKMPATDNVIAMKLMLENDEEKVLKMANRHGEHSRSTIVGLKVACAGEINRSR